MKIKSKKKKQELIPLKNLSTTPDDHSSRPRDFFKNSLPDLNDMLNQVIAEKGNFFCSQPFVHMYVPTYGYQHICCNTSMSVKKHISEASGFKELYNEPEFSKLREEIANNHENRERTLKTCIRCIQTEYHGFSSLRESYNKSADSNENTQQELKKLVQYVRTNGGEIPLPEKLHTVELKVWGNYCNLRCLMCSPEDSSEVAKEQIELGFTDVDGIKKRTEYRTGKTAPFNPPLITVDDNHLNENEYWDIIDRAIRIKLIGGETWLQKQNIQLLERLVKSGKAHDKELIIFTNNYGHPNMEYIRDLLSNFKKIVYKCSMELWGPKNDYIRYPSRWEEVYANMKLMNSVPQLAINITCTLNPITLGYVDEILVGANEFNAACNFSSVNRPNWFTAHCVPDDIRDFYLDRYYSLNYSMIDECGKAIDTLEKREFNEQKYFKMIDKIKKIDSHRGNNILEYFPEWKTHFKS